MGPIPQKLRPTPCGKSVKATTPSLGAVDIPEWKQQGGDMFEVGDMQN